MIVAGLVGALIAAVVTVLALNFVASEKQIERKLEHRYTVDDPQFRRELGILLGPPIIDGNRITNLENGVEIFPAMLEAVKAAPQHQLRDVHLLVGRDRPRVCGSPVRARPRRRRGAGADRLGRQPEDRAGTARLDGRGRSARGALSPAALVPPRTHEQSHPPQAADRRRARSASPAASASRTTGTATRRRRITGAIRTSARGPGRRADAGGVHGQLDQDHRHGAAGRGILSGAAGRRAEARAQVFTSSPSGGGDSMLLMYLLSITAAERTIDLSASYFVPDDLTRAALRAALERGVRVRIIVPGEHIDTEVVRKASRARGASCSRPARRSTSSSPRCSTARC